MGLRNAANPPEIGSAAFPGRKPPPLPEPPVTLPEPPVVNLQTKYGPVWNPLARSTTFCRSIPGSNGVFRVGGGVSAPVLLRRVDPEYSEEARKSKYQGTVLLSIQIDPSGKVNNVRVLHSLGLGLDEKAMECVKKWKFRPGFKDGKPVTTEGQVEVNFRLL